MKKKLVKFVSVLMIAVMLMSGCTSAVQKEQTDANTDSTISSDTSEASDTKDTKDISSGTTNDGADLATTISANTSAVVVNKEFSARDIEVGYEVSTATKITLNSSSIEVNGKGATAKDNVVTITEEGSYLVEGTLKDGQILIDADDQDKVQLILNGASITCSSNAPIYIKNADKVFLTLPEGSKNSLTDGAYFVQTDENEVDAVIYSKADLTLNGSGSLIIQGNYKHGIVSKDDLVITSGSYTITAVKDAINGKDCVKIKDGSFTLNTTEGNGIQSKNGDDKTKGYVYISGGTININNCYEGIEGTVILIEDGTIVINASDDGLNATSARTTATTENSKNTTIKTDTTPTASAMSLDDPSGSEDITVTMATDEVISSSATVASPEAGDDTTQSRGPGGMKRGQMPAGEAPQGEFPSPGQGGFDKDNPFEVDENSYISISGGTITINAQGDGIDSNGSLSLSGGTVYVNGPTENGNGSLDYNGTAEITGGTIIAVGSSGMAQGFSDTSTQCSLLYLLPTIGAGGSELTLKDANGKEIISFTPDKQYQSVVISSPKLTQGETYTLTSDNQSYEITLSSIVTSNAQSTGMGQRGLGR